MNYKQMLDNTRNDDMGRTEGQMCRMEVMNMKFDVQYIEIDKYNINLNSLFLTEYDFDRSYEILM